MKRLGWKAVKCLLWVGAHTYIITVSLKDKLFPSDNGWVYLV